MATVEAPVPVRDEQIEDSEEHDDDPGECHLYFLMSEVSVCGRMTRTQDRCCKHPGQDWKKGMTSCPIDGALICLECLLKLS